MIYFIQEESKRGLIKIGFTGLDIRLRLSQLQTSSPDRLILAGVMDGDKDKEVEIHTKFTNLNYRAEWFRPGDELLEFIKCNSSVPQNYKRNGTPIKKWGTTKYINHLDAYKLAIEYGMKFDNFKDFLMYYQQSNGPFTKFPGFRIAIKISEFNEWLTKLPG